MQSTEVQEQAEGMAGGETWWRVGVGGGHGVEASMRSQEMTEV